MLEGIDTSNLNGDPSSYAEQWWYIQAQFVIAQAIPRGNLTQPQLQQAKSLGKYAGIYTWLWHDPSWRLGDRSVTQDQQIRLASAGDAPVDMRPWLDVEDNQSTGWQVGIGQRKADVLEALGVLDEFASGRGLPPAGIYTSQYFINLLFGGDLSFIGDRKLWLAHYSRPPGSLIGGNVVAHQYASTPVDRDQMLESEVEAVSPPESDCSGLVNALGYISGDVIAPLRSYKLAKVKAALAEIDRVAAQFGIA
jgi:GH25 family lysozyme M1 (1,4-beta-N-acetylmuramidase)